jgi:aminotransferase
MSDSRSRHRFVSRNVQDIPKSGIRDFFDVVNRMPDAISLGVGEPGCQTPWHIRDAAMFALERGATGYTSNLGLLELRRSIASYVSEFFGVDYSPDEEILVTTGVSEGLDLAVRAVAEPGEEILYHEPCYVSYGPVIQLARAVPVAVPTTFETGFRLTAENLAPRITPRTRALILNFPNNPTGATMNLDDLEAIAALAREHDLLVISDEIYAELTYEGRHVGIACLPGMRERTILLHGLSKAWAMTGFRLGYSCAPRELTSAMMTIHQYTMLCAPTLSQVAGVEAFRRVRKDVHEMTSMYRRHRNFMVESFTEMGLPCGLPQGAFYAFPRVDHLGVTSRDFAFRLLDEEKIAVVPGEAFGPSGRGFVRCSFATSMDHIKAAMGRMGAFVNRLRSSRTASLSTPNA